MTSRMQGTKCVLFTIFFCLLLSSLHHTTRFFWEMSWLFPGKWPLLEGRQMAAAIDKPSSPPWPCVTQKPWRSLCWRPQVSSWIWVTGSTKPWGRHPRVTQTRQGPFLISGTQWWPNLHCCNCNDLGFRLCFFRVGFTFLFWFCVCGFFFVSSFVYYYFYYYYFLFSPCSLGLFSTDLLKDTILVPESLRFALSSSIGID